MAFPRWLLIPVLVTSSAAAFAACSTGADPTTGTASGTSSSGMSGMGGMGGMGGAGGAGGAAGTTASTGTASPDAGPLVCKNHTYSTIKGGPCDLLQQNCPEGRTCKEFQSGGSWTTHCLLATGLKGEGQKCAADQECLAKLTCAAGRCAPVCCAATNAPCLGGICDLFIQLDSTNKVNKQVCHYAKACTLLTKDACDQGFSCHVEDNKQGLATCIIESSDSPVADLGACHYLNDCGDMAHCLGGTAAKAGKCHFYCYLDQADPLSPGAALGGCPVGQTCQPSNVDGLTFELGLPNVGLCAPID